MDSQPWILMVEDDGQVADMIRAILEAAKFRVRHAATLKTALEAAALTRPDVILLDLILPDTKDMEGIRAFANFGAPVIVVTGHAQLERPALDNGAAAVLLKPDFTPEELLAEVSLALGATCAERDFAPLQGKLQRCENLAEAMTPVPASKEDKRPPCSP